MHRRTLYFGTVVIFTLCIWGHVSELFDHWDNTFRSGNDVEYSTVIVALVAGAVICSAHFVVVVIRSRIEAAYLSLQLATSSAAVPMVVSFIAHSPPVALRI